MQPRQNTKVAFMNCSLKSVPGLKAPGRPMGIRRETRQIPFRRTPFLSGPHPASTVKQPDVHMPFGLSASPLTPLSPPKLRSPPHQSGALGPKLLPLDLHLLVQ